MNDFHYSADGYLVRAVPFLGSVQKIDRKLGRYRVHGKNATDPWSDAGGFAAGFRRKIVYSQNEFDTVRKFAEKYNLPVSSKLGEHDPDYLGHRLFSLLIDPDHHPINEKGRAGLLLHYIIERWRSPWSLGRRIISVLLPAIAAFTRPSTAAKLINVMSDSRARPRWMVSLKRLVRGAKNT